jgi:hypothetical protein
MLTQAIQKRRALPKKWLRHLVKCKHTRRFEPHHGRTKGTGVTNVVMQPRPHLAHTYY